MKCTCGLRNGILILLHLHMIFLAYTASNASLVNAATSTSAAPLPTFVAAMFSAANTNSPMIVNAMYYTVASEYQAISVTYQEVQYGSSGTYNISLINTIGSSALIQTATTTYTNPVLILLYQYINANYNLTLTNQLGLSLNPPSGSAVSTASFQFLINLSTGPVYIARTYFLQPNAGQSAYPPNVSPLGNAYQYQITVNGVTQVTELDYLPSNMNYSANQVTLYLAQNHTSNGIDFTTNNNALNISTAVMNGSVNTFPGITNTTVGITILYYNSSTAQLMTVFSATLNMSQPAQSLQATMISSINNTVMNLGTITVSYNGAVSVNIINTVGVQVQTLYNPSATTTTSTTSTSTTSTSTTSTSTTSTTTSAAPTASPLFAMAIANADNTNIIFANTGFRLPQTTALNTISVDYQLKGLAAAGSYNMSYIFASGSTNISNASVIGNYSKTLFFYQYTNLYNSMSQGSIFAMATLPSTGNTTDIMIKMLTNPTTGPLLISRSYYIVNPPGLYYPPSTSTLGNGYLFLIAASNGLTQVIEFDYFPSNFSYSGTVMQLYMRKNTGLPGVDLSCNISDSSYLLNSSAGFTNISSYAIDLTILYYNASTAQTITTFLGTLDLSYYAKNLTATAAISGSASVSAQNMGYISMDYDGAVNIYGLTSVGVTITSLYNPHATTTTTTKTTTKVAATASAPAPSASPIFAMVVVSGDDSNIVFVNTGFRLPQTTAIHIISISYQLKGLAAVGTYNMSYMFASGTTNVSNSSVIGNYSTTQFYFQYTNLYNDFSDGNIFAVTTLPSTGNTTTVMIQILTNPTTGPLLVSRNYYITVPPGLYYPPSTSAIGNGYLFLIAASNGLTQVIELDYVPSNFSYSGTVMHLYMRKNTGLPGVDLSCNISDSSYLLNSSAGFTNISSYAIDLTILYYNASTAQTITTFSGTLNLSYYAKKLITAANSSSGSLSAQNMGYISMDYDGAVNIYGLTSVGVTVTSLYNPYATTTTTSSLTTTSASTTSTTTTTTLTRVPPTPVPPLFPYTFVLWGSIAGGTFIVGGIAAIVYTLIKQRVDANTIEVSEGAYGVGITSWEAENDD